MSDKTSIEWTDATFNPWWGCTKVSPGCDHCYAERDAHRFSPGLWGDGAPRRTFGEQHWRQPLTWNERARAAGRRMRVFCASMADVFDKDGPEDYRSKLWATILATPYLDWQLLTKRVGNVRRMVPPYWLNEWPANAWLGISVVNQEEADRDVPKLLALPARVRFLSCEPLLGPIRLDRLPVAAGLAEARATPGAIVPINPAVEVDALRGTVVTELGFEYQSRSGRLSWVIAGGESGPKARPMHPDWPRALRDECAAAGVPFLFKQWGEWADGSDRGFNGIAVDRAGRVAADGADARTYPKGADGADGWAMMHRAGKRAAGRELDGRTHDGFPNSGVNA